MWHLGVAIEERFHREGETEREIEDRGLLRKLWQKHKKISGREHRRFRRDEVGLEIKNKDRESSPGGDRDSAVMRC